MSRGLDGRPARPSARSSASMRMPASIRGVLRRVSEPGESSSLRAMSLREMGPLMSTSSATARVAPASDVHVTFVIDPLSLVQLLKQSSSLLHEKGRLDAEFLLP